MLRGILAAIARALMGAVTLPLRLLGIGGAVTAADVARSALAESAPAAVPRELTLGQLLRVHAWDRVEGYDRDRPARPPLPADAAAWLAKLSKETVLKVANLRPAEIEARCKAEIAAAAAAPVGQDRSLEETGLALLRRLGPARRDEDAIEALARLA
ncbi:hypothetical protein GOFOIKOB_5784 [Methylobacterium tardum]|uniref:Uncharacterized protein n=1 Tax=Methylobacterium tardum TaxID=374432 RepID=A0AA37WRJ1_9HYPH|nr:hypothetical protein [Methylobacterium tardum]URD39568.1 hypothetical protein M6G65_14940 [Methylobacterium tardum]GJE52710.1 hypothetical protein GOFOIKOB_5784 [Methylobacterium tardum]GLS68158.1 hypothetical protein GCM10007890_01700 [Methylobacterium tardum]